MADNSTPFGKSGISANLLPNFYQTPANKKFLQATIDQLYQPGTATKVSGFIGRENAKASTGSDLFVASADTVRHNYQLEPGISITDDSGNTSFFKDYIDYINQLNVFGGNTANHSRLNNQEMYSWDPHIDWDKFVNFQNYYWMPYGPEAITILNNLSDTASTFTVTLKADGDVNKFMFTPDGVTYQPVLKLYRGQTYTFKINTPSNPFSFKTARTLSAADLYTTGVSASAVEAGTITFTVGDTAPSILFYQSETDINVGGAIEILSLDSSSAFNVDTDLIGKKNYVLPNGIKLSNGMKLAFSSNAIPSTYTVGQFYVEGVGTAIKLVAARDLEIVNPFTTDETIKFDSEPFDSEPFADATGVASIKDYIVINRASNDKNPWSRYNRWFHKDVIVSSANYNGSVPALDQASRATRPIIEFEANLRLFNFGTTATTDVDLIDTFTTDVFSNIEGALGYNIDGLALSSGQRILFTADTDPLVTNKIYQVSLVNIQGFRQIHLEEVETPTTGQTVLVKHGVKNQSKMFWFNGSTWMYGQQKDTANQAPLFDVYDNDGISFSEYTGSTFAGTTIFEYKKGIGVSDTVLGFPLGYKNVSNIGDIVFNFTLVSDTFSYKDTASIVQKSTNVGFMSRMNFDGTSSYVNGWQTCSVGHVQPAIRIYKNSNITNNFDIDIFDDINNLSDLVVRVYVNSVRIAPTWTVENGTTYKKVVLAADVGLSDVVTIKAFAAQPINDNGHYEIPVNLQNNPLNDAINDFTLGEVINHVDSIIDNVYYVDVDDVTDSDFDMDDIDIAFIGVFPGTGNLRDLGNVTQYGTKFVQHSGPASLAIYHITSETNNVIRAIEQARDDYSNFKRVFVSTASTLGVDADPVQQVNMVLQKVNANKPKTSPYYFSDMVPYGASLRSDLKVVDGRIKTYPLSAVFTLDKLSNKAVGVYLNGTQLLHGRDYTFSDQGFILITAARSLSTGDIITTYEYDSTDNCFVPETPTKLGIWPKYEPMLYLDTSLVTPRWMIQGHDGSQVLAYGSYGEGESADYRDAIILELEKRIYNNIKVSYDTTIFDVTEIVPSYSRTTDYSLSEFNQALAPNFYKWIGLVGTNFSQHLSYDINNSFTYNYSSTASPTGTDVPGYWRGIYRWMLDTDRPHICPWEMLGFSVEPAWWEDTYGPAPYTSDNRVLWQDIADGVIRTPGVPAIKSARYAKPFLTTRLPVDEYGNLISPIVSGLATGTITPSISGNFVFGDVGPVEAAWRRSSHYAFSVINTAILLNPARVIGLTLDRSRIVRNNAGQLVYKETGLRIRPTDVVLPSIYSSSSRVPTAGVINYVVDLILNYIFSNNLKSYNTYASDLDTMTAKLSYRVGSFTNKDQFNLLLESKTPLSSGSVFIPKEDFSIILNKSSPVAKLTYSGVVVTRLADGFEVKGYSKTQPFFSYYDYTQSGATINVGGISESFTIWTPGEQYSAGSIVQYNNVYYRATVLNTAKGTFDASSFQALTALPIIGGRSATLRKAWNRRAPIVVPYGTTFSTVQEVVDFLTGYGEWLKDQGFVFDTFNTALENVSNWETSAREFLFWTTQQWSTGQDKWSDWTPNQPVQYGTVVRYNGEYYSALNNIPASAIFNPAEYNKLDGLSTIGNSVISLSPAANLVSFKTNLTVVDTITNSFNGYEIFKVDGTPLTPASLDSYREENTVTYSSRTTDGIYGASFYLVQHEHVVIINNNTIFNDVIYNPESGYRQERIKISSYVTGKWNGGLDIPGFIFDQAVVQNWQAWQDYNIGDMVNYQGYYYSADTFIAGAVSFDSANWTRLATKPTAQVLPNWTNLATQFTEFYSLDTEGFNTAQQSVAQHLIGYQKRQYLGNIIQDGVSEFKFYQGMVREKGTQNVLDKLFNVLGAEGKDSLTFYEEWALRVGQYGASAAFENIEFTLDAAQFRNNPQGIALVNSPDDSINEFVIQQTPNQIYLSPQGYNSTPFPVLDYVKPVLRSAGYVNSADVKLAVGSFADLPTHSTSELVAGDYVWVPFVDSSWGVYTYTNTHTTITTVTYTGTTLTFTTSAPITFAAGDWIGINGETKVNGFYKVATVGSQTFTVTATIAGFVSPYTHSSSLAVYNFVSQRISSINNLQSPNYTAGSLAWTDTSTYGSWATWEYNPVYKETTVYNPLTHARIGKASAISTNGLVSAVSTTATSQVVIYKKIGQSVTWAYSQVLDAPYINPTTTNVFQGSIVVNTATVTWLGASTAMIGGVISGEGIPANTTITGAVNGVSLTISNVATATITEPPAALTIKYSTTSTYPLLPTATAVAFSADATWMAVGFPTAGGTLIPSSNTAAYYTVDSTVVVGNTLSQHGAVALYKADTNGRYTLVDTIVRPVASANFGSSLVFGNNTLFIGAPGESKVHKRSYVSTQQATKFYNPLGSSGTTVVLSSTSGLAVGMIVTGTGFTSGYVINSIVNSTTIKLNKAPSSTPSGTIVFSTVGWKFVSGDSVVSTGTNGLGTTLSISNDGDTLASGYALNTGGLCVNLIAAGLSAERTTSTNSLYAVSSSGKYIAIADNGVISIYNIDKTHLSTSLATPYKTLTSSAWPTTFGDDGVKFLNDDNTILVFTPTAPMFVYDRYDTNWVLSEQVTYPTLTGAMTSSLNAIAANSDVVFIADSGASTTGVVYCVTKQAGVKSWAPRSLRASVPDVKKVKQAFLYNKKFGNLITHLDVVDPIQGKIPGPAEAEIRFKTFYDPAAYNLNAELTDAWTTAHVGMLWWNLTTAKFVENYTDDVDYRNIMWNTLATGASIDIYEWVSSSIKPSAWDAKADTVAGLAVGISGKSLYGDSQYSVKQTYDTISKSPKYTYYFWVNNKKVVPHVAGRNISAAEVSALIANPRGQGYTCLALTGANSFSLVNAAKYLSDADVVLSVEYWLVENTSQNIHSQWKMISDDPVVTLPSSIEQKWFDSLCGIDIAGRRVPDMSLPPKLRYGIENRPRQGMFVNRIEALKIFIERANRSLLTMQVAENTDISSLNKFDPEPNIITGMYDTVLDTDAELRFANFGSFKKPSIEIQTAAGAVIGITILSSGIGYLVAPYLDIVGTGTGAVVRAIINTLGQVIGATIVSGGEGYTTDTTCTIRDYSALVHSDSNANGNWSIYSYDPSRQVWSRTLTQTFDVRKYWSYVDWFATGYNQFSAPDFAVNTIADLNTISPAVGELVKIRSSSAGTWILLEKYATSESIDWTQSYNIVGIQNGTIQLSASLYDFVGTNIGYDSSTYDGDSFDIAAALELRIILDTLKSNIFAGAAENKKIYLDLFFASVRYVFSEQVYIDWIFKTSFVRATYNLGTLDQPVNYPVDNIANFEDYIAEVKPYRTKVREYISDYTSVEQSQSAITDFDLQPTYINNGVQLVNTTVSNGHIVTDNAALQTYPWKFWADNVGYSIVELVLVDGGAGYTSDPTVTISSSSGTTATAKAYISNGKVNRVVLLTAGSGYLAAPTVIVSGGTTAAQVVAIIGDGVVRTNKLSMNFDRVLGQYYITQLAKTASLTGTGSRVQFPLSWAPDIRVGKSSVTINGTPVLRETYTLTIVKTKSKGFTSFYGNITFSTAPALNSTIIVSYNVDVSLMSAADRIQYFYNPTAGELGNDLSQLMSGVDYGGVTVNGLGFNISGGWDSSPYYSDKWDSFDPTYSDWAITVSDNQRSFTLPYTPEVDTAINVYNTALNVSSTVSDGSNLSYYFDIRTNMPSVSISIPTVTVGYHTTSYTLRHVSTSGSIITVVGLDTTGVVPGMGIIGEGFTAHQTVKSVVNSTTITIDAVPTFSRVVGLDEVIPVTFTNNYAGSTILTVNDTSGLEVGDVAMSSTVSAFAYQTRVTQILSSTTVVLSAIMFANLPASATVAFERALTSTIDYALVSNAQIDLINPVIAGATVSISGKFDPIRLDDLYYGVEFDPAHPEIPYQTNSDAIMPTPQGFSVATLNVVLPGTYTSIPPVYIGASPKASNTPANNALVGSVAMVATDASIVVAGSNYSVNDLLTVSLPAGNVTVKVVSLHVSTGNVTATASGPNVTVSSTTGLAVGQSFTIAGSGGGGLVASTNYYVCNVVDAYTVKLSTSYANAIIGTFVIFTPSTIINTTFTAGAISGYPQLVLVTHSPAVTSGLSNIAHATTTTGNGVGCTLSLSYGVSTIELAYGGFGYTTAPTVTIGRPWVANATVSLGDDVFHGVNHYTVTTAGTFDSQAPIHITGTVTYGTVSLEYAGTTGTAYATTSIGTIKLPATYTVAAGDTYTLRQSTSDGSIKPQDVDYDTSLSGGTTTSVNGAYTTATGIAADDIVIDGDGFVTPISSPATEEVVPGQVVDAVAIKVFDQPIAGNATVKVSNAIADGSTTRFAITQTPNSASAVIVKVDNVIQSLYTSNIAVDYSTNEVIFNTAPSAGSKVNIFSIGFAGTNILDIGYFVANGNTTEFVTSATWTDHATSLVYLDGQVVTPVFFKTDSSYDTPGVVGFRFDIAPNAGLLINYSVVEGTSRSFAVTTTEHVATDGATSYSLQNLIGTALLNETNMIVRVNQRILTGPNNSYFKITRSKLNYKIDNTKILPNTVPVENILVTVDRTLLQFATDYTVDLSGITITINKRVQTSYAGKTLVVSVISPNSADFYMYDPVARVITFATPKTSLDIVEVFGSYVHEVLDIERSTVAVTSSATLTMNSLEYYTYKNVAAGLIKLDRSVINENYVWVSKTGTLLTPNVDYKLNDDCSSITLSALPLTTDVFDIITFGSNVLGSRMSYMQFKDMLNRVTYKRLNADKRTYLAVELNWNDTTITLTDASMLSVPNPTLNKPGIIEIRGERIEYFAINGNVLSRLRRGTLGTSVYAKNVAGSHVLDIGATETIPYADATTINQVVSNGTLTVPLDFAPSSVNDIEVFVGGYDTSAVWTALTKYYVDDIVNVGSYTYRCVVDHTSGTAFVATNWQFFVGNIRLKKAAYSMHNVNTAQYSPEGDVILDADFTVDGVSKQLTLTHKLAIGTRITVVRRTLKPWDGKYDNTNIRFDSSKVANFIKAVPGVEYTRFLTTSPRANNPRFDNNSTTLDSGTITFDQGN